MTEDVHAGRFNGTNHPIGLIGREAKRGMRSPREGRKMRWNRSLGSIGEDPKGLNSRTPEADTVGGREHLDAGEMRAR